MIKLIDDYLANLKNSISFKEDYFDKLFVYKKEELNELFKRYSKLSIFDIYDKIAEYICNYNNLSLKYQKGIIKKLYELSCFDYDLKHIYANFFKSIYFKSVYSKLTDSEILEFINRKEILYEDSLLFIYMKGKLKEFPYSNKVLEIVIDEAQDYNKIQYIILKNIFKRASFTILGDVNQTINPYYHYKSLEDLKEIFLDSKYLRLTKTYRSSKEIIEYANNILKLNHVVAIRNSMNKPVLERKSENILDIKKDLDYGIKNYKRIAIITKNDLETNYLYNELKNDYNISNMLDKSLVKNTNLVIIPSYLAKGLEFDYVIVYTSLNNKYKDNEKYLFYVAVTRCQHELVVYNN